MSMKSDGWTFSFKGKTLKEKVNNNKQALKELRKTDAELSKEIANVKGNLSEEIETKVTAFLLNLEET